MPAAAGAEIGGDWYDAFLQPDGATVLAIGDVVGHDTGAAAAMGQVRGLLRGIGYSSGGSPAEVLRRARPGDARGCALDTMATALVARLEQDDDGAGTAGAALVQRRPPAAGGAHADGTVDAAGRRAGRPAARRRPGAPRAATAPSLRAGATVLLYTDGLVERRDRDLDAGIGRAGRGAARAAPGCRWTELCDRVLERLFLPDAEDDVAVLAVRISG